MKTRSKPKTTAALLSLLFLWGHAGAGAQEADKSSTSTPPAVVTKVANAAKRGASAAASGIERGAKAAGRGIERGAKATEKAANRVADKVGKSTASSPAADK